MLFNLALSLFSAVQETVTSVFSTPWETDVGNDNVPFTVTALIAFLIFSSAAVNAASTPSASIFSALIVVVVGVVTFTGKENVNVIKHYESGRYNKNIFRHNEIKINKTIRLYEKRNEKWNY